MAAKASSTPLHGNNSTRNGRNGRNDQELGEIIERTDSSASSSTSSSWDMLPQVKRNAYQSGLGLHVASRRRFYFKEF